MHSIIEQIVSSLNYSFDNINLVYIDDKMKTEFINSTLKLNQNKENTFLVVCNSSYINYSEFNELLNEFNKINIFKLNNELILGLNIDNYLSLLHLNKHKVKDYSTHEYFNIIKNIILLLSQTSIDNNKLFCIKKNQNNITLWKYNFL